MKKSLLRIVTLCMSILIAFPTTAFALDTRANSRIKTCSALVRVENNGDLSVFFSITASTTMDVIGANKIVIQRYNGSKWVAESTLIPRDYPEMQTNNASQYSALISYAPDYSSSSYRAVVTVYAADNEGYSTAQAISN